MGLEDNNFEDVEDTLLPETFYSEETIPFGGNIPRVVKTLKNFIEQRKNDSLPPYNLEILLDTNFLIYCANKKLDYVKEIGDLINENYELVVPRQVVEELEKIRDETPLKILKNNKIKIIRPVGKHSYDAISNFAKEDLKYKKNIVFTMDRKLDWTLDRAISILKEDYLNHCYPGDSLALGNFYYGDIDKSLDIQFKKVASKLNSLGLEYTGVKKETGSHSIVFQFQNPNDENFHAIKINYETDNNREVLRARKKTLKDITNSEGRIESPFIVNAEVYDSFIKMPWYDEFLSDRLEDGEKVEIRSAIDYSKTLLESLCEVHDVNGLDRVHRDIKPDNIAIDSSKRLLIADFGISTCADPDEQLSDINGGTGFHYTRSPEAFDSEERETKASDVFSTANLIGRMMTGKYLYDGFFNDSETMGEAEDRIREIDEKEHNEILKGYLKQVPRHFRKFLRKSMAYNSEKRYQDAPEMKVGLDKAVKKYEPATLGRKLRNHVITLLTGLSICGAGTAYHASHQIEDLKNLKEVRDMFLEEEMETYNQVLFWENKFAEEKRSRIIESRKNPGVHID